MAYCGFDAFVDDAQVPAWFWLEVCQRVTIAKLASVPFADDLGLPKHLHKMTDRIGFSLPIWEYGLREAMAAQIGIAVFQAAR